MPEPYADKCVSECGTVTLVNGPITTEVYLAIYAELIARGYDHEIDWSEGLRPPTDADTFAREAIFVICNSGMKAQVARPLFERIMAALARGNSATTVFRHALKCRAIDRVWRDRASLYREFMNLQTDVGRLAFCSRLDHIGEITKYHLAKNLGVDCAKPDRHLVRVAAWSNETAESLCRRIAAVTGDRIATVDLVIWRACNLGLIDSASQLTPA